MSLTPQSWTRRILRTPRGHWVWVGELRYRPTVADIHQRLFGGRLRKDLTCRCEPIPCLHPLHAIAGPPATIQGAAA